MFLKNWSYVLNYVNKVESALDVQDVSSFFYFYMVKTGSIVRRKDVFFF